mgnify:CR=1 FL=1
MSTADIVARVRIAHEAGAGFHLTDQEMEAVLTAASKEGQLRATLSDTQWALSIFLHAYEGDHRPPARAIAIAQGARRNLANGQGSGS